MGFVVRAGSVQDNVLFDMEWSSVRYNKALAAACLQEDLQNLPAGDQTELGEGVRASLFGVQTCYAPHDCTMTWGRFWQAIQGSFDKGVRYLLLAPVFARLEAPSRGPGRVWLQRSHAAAHTLMSRCVHISCVISARWSANAHVVAARDGCVCLVAHAWCLTRCWNQGMTSIQFFASNVCGLWCSHSARAV